jgi:Helicase HerA, central domain
VANALEPVKAIADITLPEARGAGVSQLARRWLEGPESLFGGLRRHDLYLGDRGDLPVRLSSTKGAILIAGSSGAGKSRLTRLLVERLTEAHYQLCVIDPESDYANLNHFSHLGDANRTPTAEEVTGVLAAVQGNVALNLLATDVAQRAVYFADLWGRLSGLRANAGRPHWLVLDEAHHLCPRNAPSPGTPAGLYSTLLVSSRPDHLAREVLRAVRTLIAVGEKAPDALGTYCELIGRSRPLNVQVPKDDEVLVWSVDEARAHTVAVGRAKQPHARHVRKYVEGRLGDDNSFYFRGPHGALHLKAFNLATFLELAQGVDADTWQFHLERSDYSRWFREVIKDEALAKETESIELAAKPAESIEAIAAAIKRRYAISNLE